MLSYIFGESVENKAENKSENKEIETKAENKEIDLNNLKIIEYEYLVSIDNDKHLIFNTKEKAEKYLNKYTSNYTDKENYYLYLVLNNDCFDDNFDIDVYKIMKCYNVYLISYDTLISTIKISKIPKMDI